MASGKRNNEPLLADAQLTLRYEDTVLSERHIAEGQVKPASLATNIWQVASKFALHTSANKVAVQTRTLGTWALVRPQQMPSLIRLPVVVR